jgi:hypothetical protein
MKKLQIFSEPLDLLLDNFAKCVLTTDYTGGSVRVFGRTGLQDFQDRRDSCCVGYPVHPADPVILSIFEFEIRMAGVIRG